MGNSFINFTNHPKEKWDDTQRSAAEGYGEIIDLPFPPVRPEADEEDIRQLAAEYADQIKKLNPEAVLCQGEFTLCFAVVEELRKSRIPVMAACSERIVKETADSKVSVFHFVRFRQY